MSDIQQGLLIAAIGMGLVFFLIILLWLLMALMMRVTSNEKRMSTEEGVVSEIEPPSVPDITATDRQKRAAAVAVGAALVISSDQGKKKKQPLQKGHSRISPWLTYHRARQVENKK